MIFTIEEQHKIGIHCIIIIIIIIIILYRDGGTC
jgi:hypothetical protein